VAQDGCGDGSVFVISRGIRDDGDWAAGTAHGWQYSAEAVGLQVAAQLGIGGSSRSSWPCSCVRIEAQSVVSRETAAGGVF
jgi:hypothetical protein